VQLNEQVLRYFTVIIINGGITTWQTSPNMLVVTSTD
jgi:hypothetical protein